MSGQNSIWIIFFGICVLTSGCVGPSAVTGSSCPCPVGFQCCEPMLVCIADDEGCPGLETDTGTSTASDTDTATETGFDSEQDVDSDTDSASDTETESEYDTDSESDTTPEFEFDFGDAPQDGYAYPTTLANNGARHAVTGTLWLGKTPPDAESDGKPSEMADNDDLTGLDDEGGILFTSGFVPGNIGQFEVLTGSTGVEEAYLHAWIDWNRDGRWTGNGEKVLEGYRLATNSYSTVEVDIPVQAELGKTYARFRLISGNATLDPFGAAADGEVEDFRITIGAGTPCDDMVAFRDGQLETIVRETIGKPVGDLYAEDFENLERLERPQAGITDLTNIQCLDQLIHLNLRDSFISNLAPISGLSRLKELFLGFNQISDLSPLAGMTQLTACYFRQNEIRDISALRGLENLTYLSVDQNQIADIAPLAPLINLSVVSLRYNLIQDIGPLVENPGIDTDDLVSIDNNRLDCSDSATLEQIRILEERGVSLLHDCEPGLGSDTPRPNRPFGAADTGGGF